MKDWGIFLSGVGVILVAVAVVFQPTVSSGGDSYYNLGLLQYQRMAFESGIGSAICGCLLLSADAIRQTIVQSALSIQRIITPAENDSHSGGQGAFAEPSPAMQNHILQHYGIKRDGDKFMYAGQTYSKLDDAVSHAWKATRAHTPY